VRWPNCSNVNLRNLRNLWMIVLSFTSLSPSFPTCSTLPRLIV
jgi:hypothetical protein